MSQFWKIICLGAVAVLVFDTVASLASKELGFFYGYASIGSVLIYGSVGYFSYRKWGIGRAVGAAILVELVDATLGWSISWYIGPGALPTDQISTLVIVTTLAFAIAFAVICSLIGSAIARVLHGPRSATSA
jgi:hypothetical protein